MNDRLDIDRIAFIGRTYEEYMRIFGLDEPALKRGPVLDCPSGAASFTAEAHRKGVDVISCDVLYDLPLSSLIEKGREDIRLIYEKVSESTHLYSWDYYKDRDGLVEFRKKALDLFSADFPEGYIQGRYRQAALPRLPFRDGAFSLVLSSHFLFLYGDMLDVAFHKACLKELVRVSSGEIRIFPLQGLDARPYRHLDDTMQFLDSIDVDAEIAPTAFEFQKGSNRLMKLRRR